MLREYETIVVKRLACEITDKGTLTKEDKGVYKYVEENRGLTCLLTFTATKKPVIGDFIIQESKEDTYHCPKEVFNSKYKPTYFLM